MKRFIQGEHRGQSTLLPESLDDYLIHAESQQTQPDAALIAEWEALDQEIFDVQYSLPGSDVKLYQQVIEIYGQRNRELRLREIQQPHSGSGIRP